MMDSMMLLRLAIILLTLALAIILLIAPGRFPGAPNLRVPVVIGLILLAALNFLRFARARQTQTREQMLKQIPKKPLGL
jgi:hypothetical protein